MIVKKVSRLLSLNDFDSIQMRLSQENDIIFMIFDSSSNSYYQSLPMKMEIIDKLKKDISNIIKSDFDEINVFICQSSDFNIEKTIIFTDDYTVYKEVKFPLFLEEINSIVSTSISLGKLYYFGIKSV